MGIEDNKYYKTFKKHEKVIHAVEGILVILLLLLIWTSYFKSNKLQEKINDKCGWQEEDYQCYCERSEALALKSRLQNDNITVNYKESSGVFKPIDSSSG